MEQRTGRGGWEGGRGISDGYRDLFCLSGRSQAEETTAVYEQTRDTKRPSNASAETHKKRTADAKSQD